MHLYRFILYSFVCISSMSYYWCGPRLLSNNACPYDLYVLFLCPSTPLYRSSLGRPCRSCILYIVCIHHLIRCYTLGLIISYFFLSLIITKIYHCIIDFFPASCAAASTLNTPFLTIVSPMCTPNKIS